MSEEEARSFWFEEFWKGLNRLYDESLVHRDEIIELRKVAEAHQRVVEAHQRVVEAHQQEIEAHQQEIEAQRQASEAQRHAAQAHEKRLDRLDVLVEWLAEKERGREQRQ